MSTLIIGVLMAVAMQTLGGAGLSRARTTDRALARGLADALVTEIMAKPYKDPNQTPVLGREAGEPASPRSGYDDTDDYNGLIESPPQESDGTTIPGTTGFTRTAAVECVSSANLSAVSASDTGVKRITVTVTRRGITLARRVALRTRAS